MKNSKEVPVLSRHGLKNCPVVRTDPNDDMTVVHVGGMTIEPSNGNPGVMPKLVQWFPALAQNAAGGEFIELMSAST